ncbi:hypothetical protein [Aquiflexum sp.]|uniref:hypothetical protein n=1 Tax=Aquiflexum sp. TaxID=1872584 RepID=UPI0035936AE6
MPALDVKGIRERITGLEYRELWPGYSVAETRFSFQNLDQKLRLITQKESADKQEVYKHFLTTSDRDTVELLSKVFSKRWTIE